MSLDLRRRNFELHILTVPGHMDVTTWQAFSLYPYLKTRCLLYTVDPSFLPYGNSRHLMSLAVLSCSKMATIKLFLLCVCMILPHRETVSVLPPFPTCAGFQLCWTIEYGKSDALPGTGLVVKRTGALCFLPVGGLGCQYREATGRSSETPGTWVMITWDD